jgi:hypothetical protein
LAFEVNEHSSITVMAGQKREARVRPNVPAIHVLLFDRADAL